MTKEEALAKIKELEEYVKNCDSLESENDPIFLFSAEEYEKYKNIIPPLFVWWWLRSPGYISVYATVVNYDSSVDYDGFSVSSDVGYIRPAIRVEKEYYINQRFSQYNFPWIYLGDGIAIAEVPIAARRFDGESNDYEKSEIRQFLLNWIKERQQNMIDLNKYLELSNKFPWCTQDKYDGDREADKELIREYNRALIDKYPWLLPRNRWTGEVPDDYDWDYTELDAMPEGWRKAFGNQMCEELNNELTNSDFQGEYRIAQIKEKYGELRWYDFGNTKTGYDIIDKYSAMSQRICICCGKPAKYITTGWISPYCEDCIDKINDDYVTVDEWFKKEN